MSRMIPNVWRELITQAQAARDRVRKKAAAEDREWGSQFAQSSTVIGNVRELYQLRDLVDELIDHEIIRGKELGVSFDLLGSSRQQAQQRYKRAIARRGPPIAVHEIGNGVADLGQSPLTNSVRGMRSSSTEIDAVVA
jgi:hypothetical protein